MKFLTQRFLDKPVPNHGVIYSAEWVAGAFGPPFGKAILIEEQTTNLIPVDKQKFEGWTTLEGATVTLTQNQVVPEWGALDATRIQTSGGTDVGKFVRAIVSPSISEQPYSTSIWIKNIGLTTVKLNMNIQSDIIYDTVAVGQSKQVKLQNALGNGSTYVMVKFIVENPSDSLDIIAWHPQVEAKPYCTSYTPTTRQPDRLTLPASVLNEAEGEISMWAYEDGVVRTAFLLDASYANNAAIGRMYIHKTSLYTYEVVVRKNVFVSFGAPPLGYHLIKTVWKPFYVAVFVDGVKKAEKVLTTPITFSGVTNVWVGSACTSTLQWNAPIDNLVIRNKTGATPEEIAIKAAEEYNNGWVPPDANTVYHQDFDGSLAAICPFTKKITENVGNYIDDNGDAHVLVRSRYPSDGIKPAAVYTDYVDLRTKTAYVQNPKITRMGPNLLQDPSFEQGGKWGTADATNRKYGDAKDGSYFMRNTYGWQVFQKPSAQAGKTYVVSAFCKKSISVGNSYRPRISVEWQGASGTISSSYVIGINKNEWHYISGAFVAPAGTVAANVYLTTETGSVADLTTNAADFDCIYFGEVESLDSPVPDYIDSPPVSLQYIGDLSLTDYLSISKEGEFEGTVPLTTQNLIANPVFTLNASNWTAVGSPSIAKDEYYLGGKSAKVNNTNYYTQTFNVTGGKSYSFAAYVNGNGKLEIQWSTGGTANATVNSTDWQRLKLEKQLAPSAATSVTVKLLGNTASYAYFDAVQATQSSLCPDFALTECSLIKQGGKFVIPENSLSQVQVTTEGGASKFSLTYKQPSDDNVQAFVDNFNVKEATTFVTKPKGLRSLNPKGFKPSKVDTTFTIDKLYCHTQFDLSPFDTYTIKWVGETEDKLGQPQKVTHYLSGCVFTDWGLQSPDNDIVRESVSGRAVKHFTLEG